MKSKKIIAIFSILLIAVVVGGIFAIKCVKAKKETKIQEEYTPQEEISEEQSKQTIVSLYFIDKESKELVPEARLINIKDMVNSPYDTLVNLLIAGPKNEKHYLVIPENTKLLKTFMEADTITLDFSSEFLNYNKEDEKAKENLIKSIVNTLTQLTEVNKVKILIDGNPSEEFSETYNI